MKLKGWQIQTLGLMLLLLLALIAIPFFAHRIPEKLQQYISQNLNQKGYHWVSVQADGRKLSLEGNAPTLLTSQAAFKLAKDQSGIATITNNMIPRLVQPYTMRINWDGQLLIINGYVPSQETYEQLIKTSHQLFGDDNVQGDLKLGAGSPEGWNELTITSVQALAKLQQGSFEITDNNVYLAGKTPYLAIREEISSHLSNHQEFQSTVHIVAADEADKICQEKFNQLLANSKVEFTPSKTSIDQGSYPLLTQLATIASLCPKAHIVIEGHTDSLGSDEANMQLSQNRAQAIVAWLFQQGIAIERLTAVGHGEHKPIADNKTEKGRGRNRRIEFIVKPQVNAEPSQGT